MDEQRLVELKLLANATTAHAGDWPAAVLDLIAEVRRLNEELVADRRAFAERLAPRVMDDWKAVNEFMGSAHLTAVPIGDLERARAGQASALAECARLVAELETMERTGAEKYLADRLTDPLYRVAHDRARSELEES